MSLERRQAILAILAARHSLRVTDLSSRLGVSEVTIRKDLIILEEQGYLTRTHGGAVAAEQPDPLRAVRLREESNRAGKQRIAALAATLIRHGETIFLDAGTNAALLAVEVRDMELRVVTNSVQVVNTLVDQPGISLMMVGGAYRHEAGSFIGRWAEENLRRVQLDHAFIGTTGIAWEGRFSCRNTIEAQTKRAALKAARSRIIMGDASKLGVHAFEVFAELEDVSALVTDAPFSACAPLQAAGLYIMSTEE